MKYQDFKTVTL